MKKAVLIILFCAIFFSSYAFAFDSVTLVGIRNSLFEETRVITPLLADSKDVILLNNMWNMCVVAITQVDAYFSMLNLFNAIENNKKSYAAIDQLTSWLNQIKSVNVSNIKSLEAETIEEKTLIQVRKIRGYFAMLNRQVDIDLLRISMVKKSLEGKRK